jgi:hypothetical protein
VELQGALSKRLKLRDSESPFHERGNQELSGEKASDTQCANISSCQRAGRYHGYVGFEQPIQNYCLDEVGQLAEFTCPRSRFFIHVDHSRNAFGSKNKSLNDRSRHVRSHQMEFRHSTLRRKQDFYQESWSHHGRGNSPKLASRSGLSIELDDKLMTSVLIGSPN